jgi:enoyl-CoA hydratase
MKSPTERLIVTVDNYVGTITFNNPARRNAMSLDMWQGLKPVMAEMDASDDVRVIVLRGGGGRAFCAGADISQFGDQRASKDEIAAYDKTVGEGYNAVASASKPVIAHIEGSCVGGGLAIALCTDIRIATPDARFGIPAAKLGIGYTADSLKPLVDLVGLSFAKEIMITARLFDASEALGMGLVNRVVPASAIAAYVDDYTSSISRNAPLSIRAAKAAINELVRDSDVRDMERARTWTAECYDSSDYEEGRTAFMEKRPAAFTGR